MRFQRIELLIMIVFCLSATSHAENKIRTHAENKNCITCHIQSNFANTKITKPVWNNKTEMVEFNAYAGNHLTSQDGFPSGGSKLCLGCHDGIVAVEDKNIYSNIVLSTGIGDVGFSLHNNHPVSILYTSELASQNRELADPSYAPSGLGGTIEEDLLEEGKIVCTSCHDIHQMQERKFSSANHFNTSAESSISLKISNRNSKLCLTCHKK